jgi:hypothetical protein
MLVKSDAITEWCDSIIPQLEQFLNWFQRISWAKCRVIFCGSASTWRVFLRNFFTTPRIGSLGTAAIDHCAGCIGTLP